MGENTQLLVSLEDTLLRELSSSQGNILDNQDLISTLDNTKQKAVEIAAKLKQAEVTKEEIGVARSVYNPVAKRSIPYMYLVFSHSLNHTNFTIQRLYSILCRSRPSHHQFDVRDITG